MTNNIKSKWINRRNKLNYLFYSMFLIAVTFLCASNSNISFFIYCFMQTSLEALILISINDYLKKNRYFILHKLFISFLFFLLIVYIINYIIITLMDTSIIYLFKTFFSAGIEGFFITIRAININTSMMILISISLISIPTFGIMFYYFTYKVSSKWPLFISNKQKLISILTLVGLILTFDLSKKISNDDYHFNYQKKMPLGKTFLPGNKHYIYLAKPLKPIRDEKEVIKKIKTSNFIAEKKPNIYLFIVETFRLDTITQEITPYISQFKEENISFDTTYANANNSHTSWYSIFHANFPYYWDIARKKCKMGSIPLNILKKLGYQINLYSSSELNYFYIDDLIFGKEKKLIDNFKDFSNFSKIASQRDLMSINALRNDLVNPEKKEANLFIVFLDAPHSEYSWPDNYPTKFYPVIPKINYINLLFSKKELPLIKNRYFNSLNFVDNSFNEFIKDLKLNDLYESALIVITGDHGEEFLEEGSLFHGTHVNHYQTNVPLFYKLNKPSPNSKMTSHMDIFPTLLNIITNRDDFSEFFDGRSLYDNNRYPYILSVGQSSDASKFEFRIVNEDFVLSGSLDNIFKNQKFLIISFKNHETQSLEYNNEMNFIFDYLLLEK